MSRLVYANPIAKQRFEIPVSYAAKPPLEAFLVECFGLEWLETITRKDLLLVKNQLVLGLFRVKSKTAVRRALKPVFGEETKQTIKIIWPRLYEHAILNTVYKLAIINDLRGGDRTSLICQDYRRELISCLSPTQYTKLKSLCNRCLMEPDLNKQTEWQLKILDDCERHIYHLVRHKMDFIVKSQRMGAGSLLSDLRTKLIHVFRWNYPFYSYEHMLRSCKDSLNKYCFNTIKYWTYEKRKRLYQEEEGVFTNRETQLDDQIVDLVQTNPITAIENRLDYSRILGSTLHSWERSAILLISCQGSGGFLLWLNEGRVYPYDDLDCAYLKMGRDAYFSAIIEYLGIPESRFQRLLNRLHNAMVENKESRRASSDPYSRYAPL